MRKKQQSYSPKDDVIPLQTPPLLVTQQSLAGPITSSTRNLLSADQVRKIRKASTHTTHVCAHSTHTTHVCVCVCACVRSVCACMRSICACVRSVCACVRSVCACVRSVCACIVQAHILSTSNKVEWMFGIFILLTVLTFRAGSLVRFISIYLSSSYS